MYQYAAAATLVLVLFSVASWGIIAERLRTYRKAEKESDRFLQVSSISTHRDPNRQSFDDLVRLGVSCFNPFQPEVMDVHALLKQYHGRLAFHGGLSIQNS